jgi:hypothetical protein
MAREAKTAESEKRKKAEANPEGLKAKLQKTRGFGQQRISRAKKTKPNFCLPFPSKRPFLPLAFLYARQEGRGFDKNGFCRFGIMPAKKAQHFAGAKIGLFFADFA